MKRFLLLFAVCAMFAANAAAQVTMSLNVRTPMPSQLSIWESDRTLVQVVLVNVSQTSYNNLRLSFSVRDNTSGRTVVHSLDDNPSMPRFALSSNATLLRYGPDILDMHASEFDPTFQSQALTTNSLPEGDYSFCVKLLAVDGTVLAGTTETCRNFTVVIPDPPALINPQNAAVVPAGVPPTFTWTPVVLSGTTLPQYQLTIVPVFTNQTPIDAVNRNTPIFQGISPTTTFVYDPSRPALVLPGGASGFAWQVQARDAQGTAVTRNDGKSEAWTFTLGVSTGPLAFQAVYPADGDTIPWLPPHLVVRFDPYSDDVTEMNFTTTVNGSDGSTYTTGRDLLWPHGPRAGQWPSGDASYNDRSRYFIIDHDVSSATSPATWANNLKRGVRYRWHVDATFKKAGASVPLSTPERSFYIGAPPPVLKSPLDSARFRKNEQPIVLRWGVNTPHALNPPDLIGIGFWSATTPAPTGIFFGISDERYKIQIARDRAFTRIDTSYALRLDPEHTGDAGTDLYMDRSFTLGRRDTGTYYWRVSWLNPSPDTAAYAQSPIWSFRIIDSTASAPPQTAAADGPCRDDCSAPPPIDSVASTRTFAVGDSISVGKFTLKFTTVSGTGSGLTGEGVIKIPFVHVSIQVSFSGIKVNSHNQMYDGEIDAKMAAGSPLTASQANSIAGALGMTNDQVNAVADFASDAARLASGFVGGQSIGLPIGFDRTIGGNRFVIGVIGMIWTPTQGKLNAVCSFPLPWLGPGVGMGLGAKNICFHPNGIGGDGNATLYLASDIGYQQADSSTFGFLFKAPTSSDSGTYVSFDCKGFKELRVRAEASFPRQWFTPSPDDGSSRVKASFTTTVKNDSGWIASASMDKCLITAAPGFGLEVQEMAIDMSDAMNPVGIIFPTGFTGHRDNTWQGFFIKRAAVTLGNVFQRTDGQPLTIAATNLMIGRGGFTASFRAENLLQVSSGSIAGWGVSIDTVAVDFVSGSLLRGEMGGEIQIPVSDSTLHYHALLGRDSAGTRLRYAFSIVPKDTINFTIAMAKLSLTPTSRIDINNNSGSFEASATLSGIFTLSGNVGNSGSSIPGINFRGIGFENLIIKSTAPYVQAPTFHFASEQHGMAGFPVSITTFGLVTGTRGGNPAAGLQIGLSVNLQPGSNTISGGTVLSIWGDLESSGGRQSFHFYSIELDSIGVAADLGAVQIQGSLRIYRTDPVYGDGFRGSISATILQQITLEATLQMGSVRNFRYWYFDAYVGISAGIAFYPAAAFYGFGGGAWYHMRQEGADPSISPFVSSTQSSTSGSSRSGYHYVPDDGVMFGFKAIVTLGTYPSSEAFNADITLSIQILSNGTIGDIRLGGAGYMMAKVTERNKAKVTVMVDIDYDFTNRVLHGVFTVGINAPPLTGGGTMVMHFEPSMWYVKIGEPTPIDHRINLHFTDWLQVNAYVLMGNNIPAPPPLPANVQAQLPGFVIYRDPALATGDGFAMGIEASFNTGRKTFLIFYGQAEFDIGFDLAILHYPSATTCDGISGTIGMNGWYAQGQIYAYLAASIGLHVDVGFTNGDFEILGIHAAAALAGGAPNPTWVKGAVGGDYNILGGLISGHCYFEFSMGSECHPVLETPLARNDVISDIQPVNGSRDVSVFTQPQAAFNFAIERQFDINQTQSDGSPRVRTFRIRVRNFALEQAANHQQVSVTRRLNGDATSATISPANMLDPQKQYTATVSAYGEELKNGSWSQATRLDGSAVDQTLSTTFTTGTAPDTIPPNMVAYSYPVDRQRFFLKDECRRGMIKLKIGMPSVFSARTGYTASFVARFVPTFGGSNLESPATYNASSATIEFQIPGLTNSTVYALQIVKKETPVQTTGVKTLFNVNNAYLQTNAASGVTRTLRNVYALQSKGITANIAENKLPGLVINPGEKLLYYYWFMTSKYDRLQQKLDAFGTGSGTAQPPFGNLQSLTATFTGQELFDMADVYGYNDGAGHQVGPLVTVSANQRLDSWHTTFVNKVYAGISVLKTKHWWYHGTTQFDRAASINDLAPFITSPYGPLTDWERGPIPSVGIAKSNAVLHTTTGASSAATSRATSSSWMVTGRVISTVTFPGPQFSIVYNQPVYIPFDYANAVIAATDVDDPDIQMTTTVRDQMRALENLSYVLPTHGSYRINFRYGYIGCQDPDTPVPVITKFFTY